MEDRPTDPKEAPCKCSQLKAELDTERNLYLKLQAEEARNAELEKLIQDAPHFHFCPAGGLVGPLFGSVECTCWKSRLTPPEAKP